MSTTPSDDPDKMPIIPHEEFRRAKRNSLLWSSIGLLTAFSLPATYHTTVSFGLAKMDVPAWLLWLMALSAVVFMLFGFARANRLLILRHSTMLFDKKAQAVDEALDTALGVANDLAGTLNDEIAHLDQTQTRSLEVIAQAQAEIAALSASTESDKIPSLAKFLQQQLHVVPGADDNVSSITHSTLHDLALSHHEVLHNWESGIRRRAEIATAKAAQVIPLARADRERKELLYSMVENLGKISTDMRTFHRSIGEGDHRYRLFHDLLPVSLLAHSAIMALLVRGAVFLGIVW